MEDKDNQQKKSFWRSKKREKKEKKKREERGMAAAPQQFVTFTQLQGDASEMRMVREIALLLPTVSDMLEGV